MTKFADPTEAIMVVKTKDNCKRFADRLPFTE